MSIFETIIRRLKMIFFNGTRYKIISFRYDSIAKEKKWDKNGWKLVPLKEGSDA